MAKTLVPILISSILLSLFLKDTKKKHVRSGIRTHAPEETGALIQRLRPLGHPDSCVEDMHYSEFMNFTSGALPIKRYEYSTNPAAWDPLPG